MHQFEDGEPIVIVYRSESGDLGELQVQYCDPPIVLDSSGKTCLHFYLYEPDGCTDLMALDSVIELRPDPRMR
jgi:hypothetical protein